MDIPEFVEGYALPSPPKWKKRDVFDVENVKDLDEKARKVTVSTGTTFEELASTLTSGAENDLQKVRALFIWLGNQDLEKDVYPYHSATDGRTPAGYMKLMKSNLGSYAKFFALLCRAKFAWKRVRYGPVSNAIFALQALAAKLQCVLVKGNCKSASYEVGDQDVSGRKGTWNAVLVDGSWQIVHPHWAFTAVSGFDSGRWTKIEADGKGTREKGKTSGGVSIRRIVEDYFLPHPDEFVYKCIAEKKEWQLLEEPWDLHKFCNVPYFQIDYFTSDYKLTSQHEAILYSVNGKCELEFIQKEGSTSNLTYQLYLDEGQSGGKLGAGVELPRTVFFETDGTKIRLVVRFHVVGAYKLTTGAGKRSAEFRLEAKEKSDNENMLPVNPPIGFGFGQTAKTQGLENPSHTSGVVVTERNKVETIRFTMAKIKDILVRLRHVNKDSDSLSKFVDKSISGNDVSIKVTMPDDIKDEEYGLQVYTDEEKLENNVLNYLLTSRKHDFKMESSEPPSDDASSQTEELQNDFEAWRQVLLSADRLLNWTEPIYPATITVLTTFIFALLWCIDQPFLTTIALFALVIYALFIMVPVVCQNVFVFEMEDPKMDKRFEEICILLMHVQDTIHDHKKNMDDFKTRRPMHYQILIIGILLVIAILGKLFNILLIAYFLVIMIILIPGYCRHPHFKKYFTDETGCREKALEKKIN